MKLDRTKPFGKVSPPMPVPGHEAMAHYEQNSILFDSQDRPVDKSLWTKDEVVEEADETAAPAPKKAAVAGKVKGKPLASTAKQAAQAPATPAAQAADAVVGSVDLAAWARGQKEYLSNEVFKAIRAKYNTQLSERRDAVDLLIAESVITADEARKDV